MVAMLLLCLEQKIQKGFSDLDWIEILGTVNSNCTCSEFPLVRKRDTSTSHRFKNEQKFGEENDDDDDRRDIVVRCSPLNE